MGERWGGGKVLAVRKVGQQLPLKGYAGFRKTFLQPLKIGKAFHTLKAGI